MFGSAILEVAIGMILIYLVLSLVMTSVQEALHALRKTRARNLNDALVDLLQGDRSLLAQFYNHPLIYALHQSGLVPVGAAASPPDEALSPPDDKASLSGAAGTVPIALLPSYIPRETFSAALTDLIERKDELEAAIPQQLEQAYAAMKRMAVQRGEAVTTELERWYDAAMDRASGRFKRSSQYMLFWLSLAIAVLLNFNSITLAQYLAVSPQQRALVTKLAEESLAERSRTAQAQGREGEAADSDEAGPTGEAAENQTAAGDETAAGNEAAADSEAAPADAAANGTAAAEPGQRPTGTAESTGRLFEEDEVNQITEGLREIGLPIGWSRSSIVWLERGFPGGKIVIFRGRLAPEAILPWILLIAGYLMTAFAVMLGAPFWFDVLNKFMVIRGTVKPREKSQDEASEDRQTQRGGTPDATTDGTRK
jgi:hypothetical protein